MNVEGAVKWLGAGSLKRPPSKRQLARLVELCARLDRSDIPLVRTEAEAWTVIGRLGGEIEP